jgi:hypothetical protein
MAIISGGLAKKYLGVPVTLVTDKWTMKWLHDSGMHEIAEKVFDHVINVELPHTKNSRMLHDGFEGKIIPFVNSNRCDAYHLSPYDKTLLIDSDFLIFSDRLNEYWDLDSGVLLGKSMIDITGERGTILDKKVSETGIDLFWATTVMFDKNSESKFFFELVDFVKENYRYYADLFRFNPKQYRNDISFSIAKHIMNGYETDKVYTLPSLLTVFDKDILHDVRDDGALTFLVDKPTDTGNFWAATTKNVDVHVINKQSIIRNKDKLLDLI